MLIKNTSACERYINNETAFILDNDASSFAIRIIELATKNIETLNKVRENVFNLKVKNYDEYANEYIKIFRN